MSKGRMLDLLNALREDGWEILNEFDNSEYGGLFLVDDEVITWGLADEEAKILVKLEFHIFGELGGRSDKLTDILYCIAKGYDFRLYFNKRESKQWRPNLKTFVKMLASVRSNI